MALLKILLTIVMVLPNITFLLFWRFATKKKNWEELKQSLARIGMKHYDSESYSNFGLCIGVVNKQKVILGCADGGNRVGAYIDVELNSKPGGLYFHSSRSSTRPQPDESDITVLNKTFGSVFGELRADKETAKRISESQEFQDHFEEFFKKWYFQIYFGGAFMCNTGKFSMNGIGIFPRIVFHFNPSLIGRLITDFTALVNHLDNVISQKQ